MELKPGYKPTEIGLIPDEWNVRLLNPVAKAGSGHTPNKKHPEYWNGNIKWISLKDSEALDKLYIDETAATVTPAGIANSSAVIHPLGTVVLSRDAGVGRSAIMKTAMAVSQHFMAWHCGPQLNNHFLYYWLQAQKLEFERVAIGSTIKTIGLPYFRALQVPLPPVAEQVAIASALGHVDALLSALTQLIAKKRDIKQAAMQQLLTGKTRLPGFSDSWEDTTLGRVGECFIGLTYKPENIVKHGLLVLRASNVQNSQIARNDNVFVDMDVPQHLITRIGDILICVRNGSRALIGKCARITQDSAGLTFGAFMSVYRTKYSEFIFHVFQGNDIQRQIQENVGATINQITNKDLNAFRVKLPPPDEQAAIAEVLSDMNAEIAALEQRLAKTRAVKQGMMQELLTGRTRLV